MFSRDSRRKGAPELERALEAWREAPDETEPLSEGARAAILRSALRPRSEAAPRRALAELFLPARRIALAAALPTLILAAVLGVGLRSLSPQPVSGTGRIEAQKTDGGVVFLIANGKSVHRIVKTTRPDSGVGEVFTSVDGRFEDRLENGASITFYRFE